MKQDQQETKRKHMELKFTEFNEESRKNITETALEYFKTKETEVEDHIIFPPEIVGHIISFLDSYKGISLVCLDWTLVVFPKLVDKRLNFEKHLCWKFDIIGRFLGKTNERKFKKENLINPLISKLPKEGKFYKRNSSAIIRAVVTNKKNFLANENILYYNNVNNAYKEAKNYDIILLNPGVHCISDKFIHKSLEFIGNDENEIKTTLILSSNINRSNISFFNLKILFQHIKLYPTYGEYPEVETPEKYDDLEEEALDAYYSNQMIEPLYNPNNFQPYLASTFLPTEHVNDSFLNFENCIIDFNHQKGLIIHNYSFVNGYRCEFKNFKSYAFFTDFQSFVFEESTFKKSDKYKCMDNNPKEYDYNGSKIVVVSHQEESECFPVCFLLRKFPDYSIEEFEEDFSYKIKSCEFDTKDKVGVSCEVEAMLQIENNQLKLIDFISRKSNFSFIKVKLYTINPEILSIYNPNENIISKELKIDECEKISTPFGNLCKINGKMCGKLNIPLISTTRLMFPGTKQNCDICDRKISVTFSVSNVGILSKCEPKIRFSYCEVGHILFNSCLKFSSLNTRYSANPSKLLEWEENLGNEDFDLSNISSNYPTFEAVFNYSPLSPQYTPTTPESPKYD